MFNHHLFKVPKCQRCGACGCLDGSEASRARRYYGAHFGSPSELTGQDDSVLNEEGFEEEEDKCNVCSSTQSLLRCGGCHTFWYCSKDHQRQDWGAHKPICLGLQKQSKPVAKQPAAVASPKPPTKGDEEEEYPEKLPPGYRTQQDITDEEEEEEPTVPPGLCGIHPTADSSQYLHALNNMAGCHKIDLPLGDSEQFDEDDEVWTEIPEDQRLGNYLLLQKGAKKRREKGALGTGIRVNGKVSIGTDKSGAPVSHIFVGKGDEQFVVKENVKVNEHVTLLPGAHVTSHMVIRGPLKYGPVDIAAEGGIHPSGSVFSQDGSKREKGLYYREECIEALLAKATQTK